MNEKEINNKAFLKKSFQKLFDEKNEKRVAIKKLFGDDPKEMRKQSENMRKKLNKKWKEDNFNLIDEIETSKDRKRISNLKHLKFIEDLEDVNKKPLIGEEFVLPIKLIFENALNHKPYYKNKEGKEVHLGEYRLSGLNIFLKSLGLLESDMVSMKMMIGTPENINKFEIIPLDKNGNYIKTRFSKPGSGNSGEEIPLKFIYETGEDSTIEPEFNGDRAGYIDITFPDSSKMRVKERSFFNLLNLSEEIQEFLNRRE